MTESQKSHWSKHVNKMIFTYNATRNDDTGFSPFELLFGRKSRLPIDIIFGEAENLGAKSYQEYIKTRTAAMREAHHIAAEKSGQCAEKGRKQYNERTRESTLKPGDRVLEKNLLENEGLESCVLFGRVIFMSLLAGIVPKVPCIHYVEKMDRVR